MYVYYHAHKHTHTHKIVKYFKVLFYVREKINE